jgi:hypothetical protein
MKNMNQNSKTTDMNDIEKVKEYMQRLGFICISFPTSKNLVYSKNGDIIIIKNKTKQVE